MIQKMGIEPVSRVSNLYQKLVTVSLINSYTQDLTTFEVMRERSGSVVECLTRDQRAAGSSLDTLCCVLGQGTLILAQLWFNPGRPVPI